MSLKFESERKFLIVHPSEDARTRLTEQVQKHLDKCQFAYSSNGTDAMSKISNSPPHIVILTKDLPSIRVEKFLEWVFFENKSLNIALIWLAPIPDEDFLIDQVLTGQLQFLESETDDAGLAKCLSRAMNFLVSANEENVFSLKFLAANEVLLRQGEPGKSVYLVRKGELKASIAKDKDEVLLGTINKGEFVGEMAYINGAPRSADVTSITDCELIEFPADQLDHLLFLKPSWSKALIRTLSTRLRKVIENT